MRLWHCLFVFFILLFFSQCVGESSKANAGRVDDHQDHDGVDSDYLFDRPLSPVDEAAKDNPIDEGVIDKV